MPARVFTGPTIEITVPPDSDEELNMAEQLVVGLFEALGQLAEVCQLEGVRVDFTPTSPEHDELLSDILGRVS